MSSGGPDRNEKLIRQDSDWRQLLTPEQYAVLFEEATERPFSHPLIEEKRAGTFLCAACGLPLFKSGDKFDSRHHPPRILNAPTGWRLSALAWHCTPPISTGRSGVGARICAMEVAAF